MNKKTRNWLLLGMAFCLTIGLWATGSLYASNTGKNVGKTGLEAGIDIAPDDSKLLFSYSINGIASLYTANPDGTDVKRLVSLSGHSLLQPVYSSNGKKILTLARPIEAEKKTVEQALYVMNADGSELHLLSEPHDLITDAVFAPDNQTVYYLKAGVFKNYSPIASKRPHDYDLFSIDVQGKNKRQITHTKEYQMSDLSISSDGQKLFFTKFTNTSDNRDFSQDKLSLFATDLQGKTLASYLPVNEVLGTPEMYDVHISPDNTQIAFSAVSPASSNKTFEYELFTMDVATKQAKQITTLHKHTDSPVYFHKQNKLLFLEDIGWPAESTYQLRTVNTDGSDLQTLQIAVPK
ncbi:hypothetical protein EGH10_19660 [Brevibacillus laterosporus]|mgnify:CR=1 FL=1|uniref:Translocation protein TolB n=1 Tax=Brevibacillus laterosporus LMG 15441 TaxID=1042163 RepID=A0A075R773_BRELA|nr:hypothetical protein [Brevibacillus laterosporus]AIG27689.1 translocation protein TolB [Brevibacillus laterosporus LMG 15441]RJL15583.1 hypothetical protein DM460_01455 [Brevibacillus laterosporus]TPH06253.1 hypothetical protein EGH10_19660 [Brevibacillus laterosporus]